MRYDFWIDYGPPYKDTTSGGTCPDCLQFIRHGEWHVCPAIKDIDVSPQILVPVTPITEEQGRLIIDLLCEIKALLTKEE